MIFHNELERRPARKSRSQRWRNSERDREALAFEERKYAFGSGDCHFACALLSLLLLSYECASISQTDNNNKSKKISNYMD